MKSLNNKFSVILGVIVCVIFSFIIIFDNDVDDSVKEKVEKEIKNNILKQIPDTYDKDKLNIFLTGIKEVKSNTYSVHGKTYIKDKKKNTYSGTFDGECKNKNNKITCDLDITKLYK